MTEPNAREVAHKTAVAVLNAPSMYAAQTIIQSYGEAVSAEKDRRIAELEAALAKAATRFDHCALMIAQGFNAGGTLRAEREMKASHFAIEARAILTRAAHNPAEQGDGK